MVPWVPEGFISFARTVSGVAATTSRHQRSSLREKNPHQDGWAATLYSNQFLQKVGLLFVVDASHYIEYQAV